VPDDCNKFAEQNAHNMGAGVYPKTSIPKKPHPHCLCYLTVVGADPDQFAMDIRQGKYDDELRRRYKANMELVRQSTPLTTALPTTAKVPTPTNPTPKVKIPPAAAPTLQLTKHLRGVNRVSGAEGVKVGEALENQALFAPKRMAHLRDVRELEGRELVEFYDTHGSTALGGYTFATQDIIIGQEVTSPAYRKLFKEGIESKWFSPCGHGVDQMGSFIAHECGHHMAGAFRENLTSNAIVWRSVAKELKLPAMDKFTISALDSWVADNAASLGVKVSKYGATNSDEVIAEIWHEFSTNPNARPAIKKIGRVIQEVAEGLS